MISRHIFIVFSLRHLLLLTPYPYVIHAIVCALHDVHTSYQIDFALSPFVALSSCLTFPYLIDGTCRPVSVDIFFTSSHLSWTITLNYNVRHWGPPSITILFFIAPRRRRRRLRRLRRRRRRRRGIICWSTWSKLLRSVLTLTTYPWHVNFPTPCTSSSSSSSSSSASSSSSSSWYFT